MLNVKNKDFMIVVNATALRSGGGLTILTQFIESIQSDPHDYLLFIHPSVHVSLESENIKIVRVTKTNFFSRIFWDWIGLNRYIIHHGITPKLVISLQNTSIRIEKSCPQLVYLHQGIPFTDYKWSVFKTSDWIFLCYKYFYAYFIFRYVNEDTHFVVQTQWVKNALIERGVNNHRILVAMPEVKIPALDYSESINLSDSKFSLFYPAASHGYKNHKEIVFALSKIRQLYGHLPDITVYLTFESKDSPELEALIKQNDLERNFRFVGTLDFRDVIKYYKAVDLVVFPSLVETFGLPLIEAAALGKPVVAVDLPYAREALSQYEGVEFCESNDSQAWAEAILNQLNKLCFDPVKPSGKGWFMVHNLIQNLGA